MGWFDRVMHPRRRAGGDPTDERYWAPNGWISGLSQAGIRVTPELALTLSAVWCAVTFVARNFASFPCELMQEQADGGKLRARKHALYPKLRRSPNNWQTAVEFWEMAAGHILLRGNFYAQIVPGPSGFVDQLIPRHPDRMRVERLPTGRLLYTMTGINGDDTKLTQDEVFHVRGFSADGVSGLSVITFGANSMGASLAADGFSGRYFKTGASAALAVKHPATLNETAEKNLRASINSYLTGLQNVGGILILDEGMSTEKLGVSPSDAQLLSTREHNVREVARWFGMPSYVLSDGGKPPTYASAYQFAQDLINYTFHPLTTRVDQRIWMDLLDPEDQTEYFAEFVMDALLRGDLQARAQFYHMGILDGWLNRNEVRGREGMNPADGLSDFLEPMNMQDATIDPSDPPPVIDPSDPDDPNARRMRARRLLPAAERPALDRRSQLRLSALALEAAKRVVRKEVAQLTTNAKRFSNDGDGWSKWLVSFYGDHAAFVAETLQIPIAVAREYAGRQGLAVQQGGIDVCRDWEWTVSQDLALLAIDDSGRAA